MITVQRQVHGYRQGHQLLASSVELPKADQTVIDRLSDVAGALRPKEQFGAYLTAYPLPSGENYVLARTWQDTMVARAGCVRTLSLIIPMDAWCEAASLSGFLALLKDNGLPEDQDATSRTVVDDSRAALSPALGFAANELLEALFLEETKPVAVFDAPEPELIATRLLTALWPSLRGRFALSTFALSPRKVSGRDFDLVFAPKDARSKFADWPGRRVDGRSNHEARHKWTEQIVRRVFNDAHPKLLTDKEVGLVGQSGDESDPAASLRIALLWEELSSKLLSTPTAALGLLDIANSGMVRNSEALSALESEVAHAIRNVSAAFNDDQAWDFFGAIARKIQDRPMPASKRAVADSVRSLSGRAPDGAVALLARPELTDAVADLLPSISEGMASEFGPTTERALLNAPGSILGRLLAQNDRLAKDAVEDRPLLNRLVAVLPELDKQLISALSRAVVPQLSHDWQTPLARPLLEALSTGEIAAELVRLGRASGFTEGQLVGVLIEVARSKRGLADIRAALEKMPASAERDRTIAQTITSIPSDISWLLNDADLPRAQATAIMVDVVNLADNRARAAILSDVTAGPATIKRLSEASPDTLSDVVLHVTLPYETLKSCLRALLSTKRPGIDVAGRALPALLRAPPGGDEAELVCLLVDACGSNLDAGWLARAAFSSEVSSPAASRNMIALHATSSAARSRVLAAVAEIADVLFARGRFDLDADAAASYADLLSDAERSSHGTVVNAAGRLLPSLMRQRRDPVSPIIVVMFATIYRELEKDDDVPDLLKFVPFWDWDRCKAARQELVSAFMSSSWPPGDLAAAACRCGDIDRILRRTAKAYGGDNYIDRISADLERLPANCRKAVSKGISAVKSDWAAKYDWRD